MGSWSGVAAGEGRPTPTQVKFQLRKAALATMADDKNLQEIQKLGGTAIKPVGWDRTGWEAFRYMLYNPDTGEVLTRTPPLLAQDHCLLLHLLLLPGRFLDCLHAHLLCHAA